MAEQLARPPTPQTMVHRLPDKPDVSLESATKPAKFIVLIAASTGVAGKVQVAKNVSQALSSPLFQGDSLHDTAARAAIVGASRRAPGAGDLDDSSAIGANEARYQRMWLSKLTRTGLLFPEESRAAGAGFSGFGGTTRSTPASRRGSSSSEASDYSTSSDALGSTTSTTATSVASMVTSKYVHKPLGLAASQLEGQRHRTENPALMVLTHPELEAWHRVCIRNAVGEYGIGVIFIPLDEDAEPPVLKPLDPRTMTSFGSFIKPARDWAAEITVTVDIEANVEEIADEIVEGVRGIMFA